MNQTRWIVSGIFCLLGLAAGISVTYWLAFSENAFLFRWRWVIGSGLAGFFGILFSTLAYWKKRKEVVPTFIGCTLVGIIFGGVGASIDRQGIPLLEVTIPCILGAFITGIILTWNDSTEEDAAPIQCKPFLKASLGLMSPMGAPLFKRLSYTSTLEETIDDHMSLSYSLHLFSPHRLSHVVAGFVLFLVLFLYRDGSDYRLEVAVGAAIAYIAIQWMQQRGAIRRRLAKTFTTEIGIDFPQHSRCGMDNSSLVFCQNTHELRFNLWNLSSIIDVKGDLILNFPGAGRLILPARAFESLEERKCWMNHLEPWVDRDYGPDGPEPLSEE